MTTDATWTDRKHFNTALKAAIAAIPLDCSGPLVNELVDHLIALHRANQAAAKTTARD